MDGEWWMVVVDDRLRAVRRRSLGRTGQAWGWWWLGTGWGGAAATTAAAAAAAATAARRACRCADPGDFPRDRDQTPAQSSLARRRAAEVALGRRPWPLPRKPRRHLDGDRRVGPRGVAVFAACRQVSPSRRAAPRKQRHAHIAHPHPTPPLTSPSRTSSQSPPRRTASSWSSAGAPGPPCSGRSGPRRGPGAARGARSPLRAGAR